MDQGFRRGNTRLLPEAVFTGMIIMTSLAGMRRFFNIRDIEYARFGTLVSLLTKLSYSPMCLFGCLEPFQPFFQISNA